jgi:hypothetical protein
VEDASQAPLVETKLATPAFSTASTIVLACEPFSASGFSQKMAFPASAAAVAISA